MEGRRFISKLMESKKERVSNDNLRKKLLKFIYIWANFVQIILYYFFKIYFLTYTQVKFSFKKKCPLEVICMKFWW